MSTERKPPTPGVPPRDDFAWPLTTAEIDSIEVIMLQPRSDDGLETEAMRQTAATSATDGVSPLDRLAQAPVSLDAQTIDRAPHGPSTDTRRRRVWAPRLRSLDRRLREFRLSHLRVSRMRMPQVHVPRVAMPRVSVSRVSLPGASGFIAAVMVARSSRLERRTGVDVAHWGLAMTSLLAIVVALVLQISEWRRTPMPTQELLAPVSRAVATTATSRTDDLVPLAMADQAPSIAAQHSSGDPRIPGERVPADASTFAASRPETAAALATASYASPATSAETPMAGVTRPARAVMGRTTSARRLRERIDRDNTPWWGRRTRAASSSRPSYSRRATLVRAGEVSPPLRLPESYVQPRLVSSGNGGRARGKVVLGVQVRSNGRVGKVNVLSGDVDRDLERAAIAAVKQWRYRPALRDGVPTPARVKIVIDFG